MSLHHPPPQPLPPGQRLLRPVGQLDQELPRGVEHRGVPILPLAGLGGDVLQMDVPIAVVQGAVAVQQLPEAGEPPVAGIVHVPQPLGGGVGDEDVHPAPPQGLAHLGDPAAHFPLCVLVGAVVIPGAPPQPQNPVPPEAHQLPVDAVAALRGGLLVFGVVVAVDVEHRDIAHGHQKAEVAGGQVPAGEDGVRPAQLILGEMVPEAGVGGVRDDQQLHRTASSGGICFRWMPRRRTVGWATGSTSS